MDLSQGDDEGPVKLLFVTRRNLPMIVQMIAPDLTLVQRQKFEEIATAMLEVVERAV